MGDLSKHCQRRCGCPGADEGHELANRIHSVAAAGCSADPLECLDNIPGDQALIKCL